MKSVMLSIKPYWLFLIIAEKMGWNIGKKKTIEVRKSYPKDTGWNKSVILYCTKDYNSLNKVPKEYRPLMRLMLGKVIGEFVCNLVTGLKANNQIQAYYNGTQETCLSPIEIVLYANDKTIYYWHISDLFIYDKPRPINAYRRLCDYGKKGKVPHSCLLCGRLGGHWNKDYCCNYLIRPPQSWCYVEALE